MSAPDVATLHNLQLEMNNVGFLTGAEALEDMAWETAWEQAEDMVGTNLLTGTVAEERHIWPRGWLDYDLNFRYLQLEKTWLISVTTATLTHDLGNCECGTDDVSACVLEYNLKQSIAEIRSSEAAISAGCGCVMCNKEAWLDVTYVAGLYNTPADMPSSVKIAIATLAQDWKRLMDTAGGSAADGFIDQWSSMDYSEKRGLLQRTPGGPSPAANAAWLALRKLRVNRMVALRGRPSQGG
jgi:hypothetical protein